MIVDEDLGRHVSPDDLPSVLGYRFGRFPVLAPFHLPPYRVLCDRRQIVVFATSRSSLPVTTEKLSFLFATVGLSLRLYIATDGSSLRIATSRGLHLHIAADR